MNSNDLRKAYLDFFKNRNHRVVSSDSLIPTDDPSLLFTGAGMNQFKKQFMGQITDYRRATSSQKCLRTDDLDKVGKTASHHTFFEMLGNFSFGDYFKKEAITWAWEFLTSVLKIDQEKLWVSVYEDDEEAYNIWEKVVKAPRHKIIKLGAKDNFWPANAILNGPNGPCGPCSEIFFDWGKEFGCKKDDCAPGCDCGRFVEIWNLVFTQFNRKDAVDKKRGILEPLPNKNIDTGMGLERMASVLQGVKSNFDIDIFKTIKKAILSLELKNKNEELINIISDHIRAITFTISDGVMPSNEERGYVLRKIIRKSFLHGRSLGLNKPFLYKLVPIVTEAMKEPYPELIDNREDIANVILSEEKSFVSILDNSNNLLENFFKDTKNTGHVAFKLYDTHGIPLEIIEDWLKQKKISFNYDEFKNDLELQKERSKKSSKIKDSIFSSEAILLKGLKSKFLGYKDLENKAKILKIIKNDLEVKEIKANDYAQIILDETSFYAESGGQVGDKGQIVKILNKKIKSEFIVEDTKKIANVIVHLGRVKTGNFKINQAVDALVDKKNRFAIMRAHSATHLLQAALRQVLGPHVRQQGSLVEPDRLRFDFTHFKAVNEVELQRIEEKVFEKILENILVGKKSMTLDKAKKQGALAFFGEKYDKSVRIISMGDYSKEFCGGTHLDSTAQVTFFKILSEGAIAKGIRRIEALTGELAYKNINDNLLVISDLGELLKSGASNIVKSTEKILEANKQLEKNISQLKLDIIKNNINNLIAKAKEINGTKIIVERLNDADLAVLRSTVDCIKQKVSSFVIILAGIKEENIFLLANLSQDLMNKNLNASNLIKEVSQLVGGSGGGRPDFAQGSGKIIEKLNQALDKGLNLIEEKLK